MAKALGGAALLIALGACAGTEVPDDRKDILAVLVEQADAWNRGDLDSFLDGYWRSDRTVFAGGGTVRRGFEAMAERYHSTYPTREKMGRLTFSNLVFEQIGSGQAVVTGSWELELAGQEKRPGGVFTLLWRKVPQGWKIVHDHTSIRP